MDRAENAVLATSGNGIVLRPENCFLVMMMANVWKPTKHLQKEKDRGSK